MTAIFNPMMGHISSAYSARVSRDLSLCSRFDFNVYSYESDWTMGAEWWIRRRTRTLSASGRQPDVTDSSSSVSTLYPAPNAEAASEIRGVVKARMSTSSVCQLSSTVLFHF